LKWIRIQIPFPYRDRQALDADSAPESRQKDADSTGSGSTTLVVITVGTGTCLWVVEIAEHLVSLNAGLVHGAEAGLRLELVEAGLHVADGRPRGDVPTTAEQRKRLLYCVL
jgi:hypothetical protein